MRQSPDPPTAPLPAGPVSEKRTQLYTYAEASTLLRVHPRTVRAWADEGRLKKITLGPQTLRVTADSVEALIHGEAISLYG